MSRRSNIKWRKSDRKKISNAVRQFNSKITRTLKLHPDFERFLPDKISVKELTSKIETRNDFNREVNSLLRFLKKGAETPFTSKSGIETTKWGKQEISYKIAQINRSRTLRRKKANVSTFKGTMGSIQENNLKPKIFDINKIRKNDWKLFIENVEKQVKSNYYSDKMRIYKENYIKALSNVFGEKGNVITSIVLNIPDDVFSDYFFNDPVLQLDFIYDPIEIDLKIESIIEHLKETNNP